MALTEDAIRHEIYLAKLTTQILNAHIYPSLEEAQKAARAILLDAENITSIKVLERIQKRIGNEATKALTAGWEEATKELAAMAVYEAGHAAMITGAEIGAALVSPGKRTVESFINQSIMSLTSGKRVNSGTWAEYVQGNINSAVSQYNGIIVNGYQQGRTVGQMARDIRESTDGLLRGQAEVLARTGQSHYANQAREAMAAANSDIIKYRVMVIVFDNRTTTICLGFASKKTIYEITDNSYPRFPAHFGCRTVYVYTATKEEALEGTRSAVGGKPADDINPSRKLKYRGKKDTDIFKPGQISADTSIDDWMRQQPDWFQDSSLGDTRAKLFRDGGIKLERFTDAVGKPLTLDQLRELDAEAFKRAKL